ncbi:MAG: hypothetical protein CVT98_02205 [Bacteroidetes bacterium HGW-Bacteroidetes-15]|nr:MAG: hypothetical protein CVT98_02205 [Bacteroidetes bacterium HGW-Bacteroidetes-15]
MKHLIAIILICYAFNGSCQIDKPIKRGDIVLGGSSSFSYSKINSRYKFLDFVDGQYYYQNSDQKSVTVSFSPLFGYFIIDGLVIGISPSYSYSKTVFTNYEGIANSFGIAPFIKYYFDNGFFADLESGYRYSILKQQGVDYKRKYSYLSVSPSVGYAFFINSKVSIEPSLKYFFSKAIDKDDIGNSYFETNSFLFSIGFHIFL